ncbi:hypothetical protein Q7X32_08975 [Glaesserella parasuis]|uniref:hypothetical protein n=1 Tax=Glaesserella parasuis TaxID=738 RepID=UPI00094F4B65|nr:hypothetical protein [Glaesserella parasuis]MDP0377549.1 hypothetical protein [Glaesserella parasuis]
MKYNLIAFSLLALPLVAKANPTWVDHQRIKLQEQLAIWANSIDDWIGTPDPNNPASAGIRIMLDSNWNRYDGYSVKPRIRGKIKLPALKQHLSVVFGDEDLDNQARDQNQLHRNYREPLDKHKRYDSKQVRDNNASLALRWSNGVKALGVDTDVDLGIRSGTDIFLRFKLAKTWKHNEVFSTRLEHIYRYGIESKHYLRTNFENKFQWKPQVFINNHTFLQYTRDLDENVEWGNSLYRQHDFAGYKKLSYGLFVGGNINKKKADLTHYGPFINWRQPIWKDWVFIQPEVHFYNNKKQNRKHHFGAFLRLEAIF